MARCTQNCRLCGNGECSVVCGKCTKFKRVIYTEPAGLSGGAARRAWEELKDSMKKQFEFKQEGVGSRGFYLSKIVDGATSTNKLKDAVASIGWQTASDIMQLLDKEGLIRNIGENIARPRYELTDWGLKEAAQFAKWTGELSHPTLPSPASIERLDKVIHSQSVPVVDKELKHHITLTEPQAKKKVATPVKSLADPEPQAMPDVAHDAADVVEKLPKHVDNSDFEPIILPDDEEDTPMYREVDRSVAIADHVAKAPVCDRQHAKPADEYMDAYYELLHEKYGEMIRFAEVTERIAERKG